LGISTVSLAILEQLFTAVDIKPAYVQVRFHPETQFEVPLRRFCFEKGITFQAHKVLKGNPRLLESDLLANVAATIGISKQTALYACILSLPGVRIVNGTKTEEHMEEDMKLLQIVAQWRDNTQNEETWQRFMAQFKTLTGDDC
jgi:diketogulonate reductase-like aldo/keto reductase